MPTFTPTGVLTLIVGGLVLAYRLGGLVLAYRPRSRSNRTT